MAMERLCVPHLYLIIPITDSLLRRRAQIMQQDQFGIYRTNNFDATNSPTSPTGLVSPADWTLSSSEASAQDHYGHPDGYPVGQIFASRCVLVAYVLAVAY